ncbi:hypothetical protein HYV82_00635 [Candidatus Woesearchaeota archaeon]|nr:hypothetical protein [Candidatus Woesearchaeota archaeon]
MTKQNYNNPKKAEVREKFRRFIKRHLQGNPSNWRVLCFPWGDGKRSYEIEQVYDPLGIPRSNIVGLERDAEKYERLKALNLGIKLVKLSDREFFSSASEQFDVVSLDYDGTFNPDRIRALELLAGRQLLWNPSVLGVTVSVKRENAETQKHVYSGFLGGTQIGRLAMRAFANREIASSVRLPDLDAMLDQIPPSLHGMDEYLKYSDDFHGINTGRGTRDFAITNIIESIMASGRMATAYSPISRKIPSFAEYLRQVEEERRSMAGVMPEKFLSSEPTHSAVLHMTTRAYVADYLLRNTLFNKTASGNFEIARIIIGSINDPYMAKAKERYSYVGTGRTPMYADFFMLRQYPEIGRRYKYLAGKLFSPINIREFYLNTFGAIPIARRDRREIDRLLLSDSGKLSPPKDPERIHLGSSYRPRLTGAGYYELSVGKGMSDDEIMGCRRTTPRQLAAFKAHVTMGTYGPVHAAAAGTGGTLPEPPEKAGLRKNSVGQSMLDIIKQKGSVNPADIAESPEQLPIVAMLMANWYRGHPEHNLTVTRDADGSKAYQQSPLAN